MIFIFSFPKEGAYAPSFGKAKEGAYAPSFAFPKGSGSVWFS